MSEGNGIKQELVDAAYEKMRKDALDNGYFLNPDGEFAKDLVRSILINRERYGYDCCPCRLSANDKNKDLDIICPCDYRDADITGYGACYCGLYVSQEISEGKKEAKSIPESRPAPEERNITAKQAAAAGLSALPLPVYRCKVCGYLCAREQPPEICPVCKAKKDRFERFI